MNEGVQATRQREELEALLALNCVRGIGVVLYHRLLERFGSAARALACSERELREVPRIGPTIATGLRRAQRERRGQRELELARREGVELLTYDDDRYPPVLRTVGDYPLVLYARGELVPKDVIAVAVVGSRRCSSYGRREAERLSAGLAVHGVTIISGLARGIDTWAHRGALKAGGRTLAVLGSGLSRIYPKENASLASEIATRGALLSEFPMEAQPEPQNFPRRNRILSALSLAVLVVEAPRRSGAMITADWAIHQGKEVLAVPGRIDSPYSGGCHQLLKSGAKMVESIEDILDELGPLRRHLDPRPSPEPAAAASAAGIGTLDPSERLLLDLCGEEPAPIDELIQRSQLPPGRVSGALLTLELKRLVRQLPGQRFVRCGE